MAQPSTSTPTHLQGRHLDWNTLIFNFAVAKLRTLLASTDCSGFDRYGIDALRVDAVASMLYLDYSRPAGGWIPNRNGGRENLEACGFLRRVNTGDVRPLSRRRPQWRKNPPHGRWSHARLISWRSRLRVTNGTWGGCTTPSTTLPRTSIYRRHHHGDVVFGLHYAFTENFILPLSHDEVVHGKAFDPRPDAGRSLAEIRQPARLLQPSCSATLARSCCSWGRSSARSASGITTGSLDWHLLDQPGHQRHPRADRRLEQTLSRNTGAASA